MAASRRAAGSVELVLEVYFVIALLSTTGIDNLLFVTALLMTLIFIWRAGAVLLRTTLVWFPRERVSAHQPAE